MNRSDVLRARELRMQKEAELQRQEDAEYELTHLDAPRRWVVETQENDRVEAVLFVKKVVPRSGYIGKFYRVRMRDHSSGFLLKKKYFKGSNVLQIVCDFIRSMRSFYLSSLTDEEVEQHIAGVTKSFEENPHKFELPHYTGPEDVPRFGEWEDLVFIDEMGEIVEEQRLDLLVEPTQYLSH